MKRYATALALFLTLTPPAHADVTVTNTITMTGPVAAMMGGAIPQMVMRVKGSRARMDVEVMGQRMSNIIDIETKHVTTLLHAQKTAQTIDVGAIASDMPAHMPPMDAQVEPTGRTQEIDGQRCTEYKYSMTLDLANFAANMRPAGAAQLPPEAAEMFKDVKMVMGGSIWVATEGAAVEEYTAFQKAAQKNMLSLSPFGGPNGSVPGTPGMENLMRAFAQLDGLTYLAEIELSFEGANPMIDMLKSMGAIKVTTKVTEVSTQPIAEELFQIPADYTVKQ